MPTAAGRWHSGHAGRPQRWQRTYASRSGWRGHTDGPAAGCGTPGSSGGWPGWPLGGLSDNGVPPAGHVRGRWCAGPGGSVLDGHRVDDDVLEGLVVGARGDRADRVDDVARGLVGDLTE